jgi:hypothetical protein
MHEEATGHRGGGAWGEELARGKEVADREELTGKVFAGEREREDACGRWRRWPSGTGEEEAASCRSQWERDSGVGNVESTGWRRDKVTVWEIGVGAGRCMFYF